MPTILGISGSLRRNSWNTALLRAAAEVAPDGVPVEVASIRGIPLYDADVEGESGIPAAVAALKGRIVAADGLLLATPEYNNSIPGVFKNAIDWLSRPPADIGKVFRGRPVALLGATPGLGGTMLAQAAWLPVLRTLGLRPWFGPKLYLSRAREAFAEDGRLVDDELRGRLREFLAGFAAFIGGETGGGTA